MTEPTDDNVVHLLPGLAQPTPVFPMTVTINGAATGPASIELFADGGWIGDGPGFVAAAQTFVGDGTAHSALIVWLVARAVKGDVLFGRGKE